MQKYKRPPKAKFKRSIPLRNPRRIDWHRWDENTGEIISAKPVISEGITSDTFGPSNRRFMVKTEETVKKISIKSDVSNVKLFLYYSYQECWLVEENYVTMRKFVSTRLYATNAQERAVIMQLYCRGLIRWFKVDPL